MPASILLACLPFAVVIATTVLLWSNRKRIKRLKLSKREGLDIQFFDRGTSK